MGDEFNEGASFYGLSPRGSLIFYFFANANFAIENYGLS